MKTLLKNGRIVNVFTDTLEKANVLLEDERIVGVGDYSDEDADHSEDLGGRILCPGFIDGHIHIESTMLRPVEFARACLPHGTTTIIADPHEIANVSGLIGIAYMLEASEWLPMNMYFVIPSCVPATQFDEAGATLTADDVQTFYSHPRVLGLGEMMNYPGVVAGDPEVLRKIEVTRKRGMVVNGHAPMLTGKALDRYIAEGIFDDHECFTMDEALEKLNKGQWIMIRQGTAARNLLGLLQLFDEPYSRRCLLVTDDKHPADLMENGHIDSIIRMVAQNGKSVLTAIRMATLQAAQRFGLSGVGAIAPGYSADLVVLDDLVNVRVRDVYHKGVCVVHEGTTVEFASPHVRTDIWKTVRNSFFLDKLAEKDFHIEPKGTRCRVIRVIPDQLITDEEIMELDFSRNNGVDTERDILKLAVVERHMNTGHIGLGYIAGMGLRCGAIASSVSHDSHNLIVVGANETDMCAAANCVRKMGGGLAVAKEGEIIGQMALPVGGLMGLESAAVMAEQNRAVREAAAQLGHSQGIEPFMNLAFVSLPVIPNIKMTTKGLIDVNRQQLVPLFVEE